MFKFVFFCGGNLTTTQTILGYQLCLAAWLPTYRSPWTGLVTACASKFLDLFVEADITFLTCLLRQMDQAAPPVPLGGWSSLVPKSPNRHRVTSLFRNVIRGFVFLGSLLAQWVRLANLCIQSIGSLKSFCWKFWIESNELNWYFKLEAIGLRSWDDGSICSIVDFTWRLGPRWTAVRDQVWLTNVFCVCCNLIFRSRPPVWAAVASVIMSCRLARPETPREVSAVDQREMIQQLQQVDTSEKKRNAEAGRGAKWCEQAQPEKHGKARREIIPYHCMPEIPDLLEAGRICLNLCFLSLCCFVFCVGEPTGMASQTWFGFGTPTSWIGIYNHGRCDEFLLYCFTSLDRYAALWAVWAVRCACAVRP